MLNLDIAIYRISCFITIVGFLLYFVFLNSTSKQGILTYISSHFILICGLIFSMLIFIKIVKKNSNVSSNGVTLWTPIYISIIPVLIMISLITIVLVMKFYKLNSFLDNNVSDKFFIYDKIFLFSVGLIYYIYFIFIYQKLNIYNIMNENDMIMSFIYLFSIFIFFCIIPILYIIVFYYTTDG